MNLSIQPQVSTSLSYNLNYQKYQSYLSFGNNSQGDCFERADNNTNSSVDSSKKKLSQRFISILPISRKKQINNLKSQNYEQRTIIDDLNRQLADSNRQIENLRAEILTYQQGKEYQAKKAAILNEIQNSDLDYDCMAPYFKRPESKYDSTRYKYVYADIKTGTNNRADMKPLNIPYIAENGRFHFELPKGEMKIKKVELKQLDEPFEIQSNISEKYSNSLVWNTDKVSRDLLQNFFDGHGQTLDGVKFDFEPSPRSSKNKYRVRIEGKSTYNYKEAILMGESQSHENSKAAGNYGEGLKMVTLKLLKQSGAPEVKIGSGNWEVKCSMRQDDRLDSQVMNYEVSPVDEFDGNYIEFETSDRELLESLRNTIDRFYHSSNIHFKEPDFENDLFGFKVLPENEKGGIYISGQKFEYDGDYDGINGGVIFIKQKIPVEKYDMSRDRTSIDSSDLIDISRWLAKNTTFEESIQIIKSLEPVYNYVERPMSILNESFVDSVKDEISYHGKGAIKFPDNYVSQTLFLASDKINEFLKRGYKIFDNDYEYLGMNSTRVLEAEAKRHRPLEPTDIEKKKILILRKTLNSFTDLNNAHFSKDELNAKIYLFDAVSNEENKIDNYEDTQAEAIVYRDDSEKEKHKGFWVDKNYFDNASFPEMIETALHELSHKEGGDGTKAFGYELTKVNRVAIKQMIDNFKLAEEFRILNEIWNNLSD